MKTSVIRMKTSVIWMETSETIERVKIPFRKAISFRESNEQGQLTNL